MQIRIRLPLSATQWQSIAVRLDPLTADDSAKAFAISNGDNADTDWQPHGTQNACTFFAPREEGGEFMRLAAFNVGSRIVAISRRAPNVADGAWHSLTLQLFSDGRCALAIDGNAVAISRNAVSIDKPVRLMIDGRSVKTTVEVGAIEAWSGVRSDIDWGSLGRHRTPP